MIDVVRSIRQQIVDSLRSDIFSARLPPGTRLSETELAERFGVSRGPIREALTQLVTEGWLISKPNCGVTVATPPPREVRELIIPIRRTLESYALKSYYNELTPADYRAWDEIVLKMEAACRAGDEQELVALDLQFHRVLVARAAQPELMALWQAGLAQIRGHFGEKIKKFRGQLEFLVEHHQKLLAVFRKGNRRAAIAELNRHIS